MSESTLLDPSRLTFLAAKDELFKSFLVWVAILGSAFGFRGFFCPWGLALLPPVLTSSKSCFGGYLLMPFGLTCFLTILAVNSLRSFAIYWTTAFTGVVVATGTAAAIGFYNAVKWVELANKSEPGKWSAKDWVYLNYIVCWPYLI